MKTLVHPPDYHQVVGAILGIVAVLLGALLYYSGVQYLETNFGGGVLPQERHFLAMVIGGIVLSLLAIAYAFSQES